MEKRSTNLQLRSSAPKEPTQASPIRILYIEDEPSYCISARQFLQSNPVTSRPVELLSARFVEEALSKLIDNQLDGVIVDLQIQHCPSYILPDFGGKLADLRSYSPARFFGIGILLSLQNAASHIQHMPKLIFSDFPIDSYSEYYYKLKGERKSHMRKQETSEENNRFIAKWITENFK